MLHPMGRIVCIQYIPLVPVFQDDEVESHFCAFECSASALRWSKDVWAIFLQCKLTGKAQEACASLSTEDGLSYEKLKITVLHIYELVPGAYRQHFRSQ